VKNEPVTNYFDQPVAAAYDEDEHEMFDPELIEQTVDVLAELAGGRPALELAVGTGRIALPLSRRGVPVSGERLLGRYTGSDDEGGDRGDDGDDVARLHRWAPHRGMGGATARGRRAQDDGPGVRS